ncbi:glycosyltransferase family 2 protein [Novosphingopyxis sp.]|uniref:glycosyltransferase family 2 protein n=1 Tax=Novosphingopyxis sp. TaxID=2709690 RepID=UPI003B5934EA
MAQEPRFTVVIPTYNSSGHAAAAIASVVAAADGRSHEVLLVDDHSDDRQMLAAIAERHGTVRIIDKPERTNAAHSRNLGFEAARAAVVFFLDSDDLFSPGHVARRLALHDGGHGVIFGAFELTMAGKSERRHHRYDGQDMAEYIFAQGADVRSSTISIDRRAHRGALFDPELAKHQDWAFAITAQAQGESIGYDQEPGVVIQAGGGHRMSTRSDVAAGEAFLRRYLTAPSARIGFLMGRLKASLKLGDEMAAGRFLTLLRAERPGGVVMIRARALMWAEKLGLVPLLSQSARMLRRLRG